MENKQYLQEEEFNMRGYLNVIIKRKKLILAIFLFSVITVLIISLRMPKVYEITTTVQLGSFKELLINNGEAKEMILNQNLLLSVINQLGLKVEVERLKKSIRVENIKDTNLLVIKITYPGIETALKINDAIINPFIAQGQVVYQEQLSDINERIKELDMEIKNVQAEISKTQGMLSELINASSASQSDVSVKAILLQNILHNFESDLSGLSSQRYELKTLLVNAKNFKISDAPIRSKNPVGPKKKQNVIIAGMFSLIFGVFLAFFLEFWQQSKNS